MKYSVKHSEDPVQYKREVNRAQRRRDPVRYLLNQIRYRAKKTGKEFDLELDELHVPTHCPIMGIPLFFTGGKQGPNSYSFDRVDNSKGYTKDNVRVISCLANVRKGDLTIEEVERLLAYMKGEI